MTSMCHDCIKQRNFSENFPSFLTQAAKHVTHQLGQGIARDREGLSRTTSNRVMHVKTVHVAHDRPEKDGKEGAASAREFIQRETCCTSLPLALMMRLQFYVSGVPFCIKHLLNAWRILWVKQKLKSCSGYHKSFVHLQGAISVHRLMQTCINC